MEKNIHRISIESRNCVELNGVTDMGAYNNEEIEIDTVDGLLIISGSDLNVTRLDVESGICTLSGKIDSILYSEKSDNSAKNILRRLFKC